MLDVRSDGSPQPRGLSVPLGAACLMHPSFLAAPRDQRLDVLGGELPQCQRMHDFLLAIAARQGAGPDRAVINLDRTGAPRSGPAEVADLVQQPAQGSLVGYRARYDRLAGVAVDLEALESGCPAPVNDPLDADVITRWPRHAGQTVTLSAGRLVQAAPAGAFEPDCSHLYCPCVLLDEPPAMCSCATMLVCGWKARGSEGKSWGSEGRLARRNGTAG